MEVQMFDQLLESMLQCVCDLWDSADSLEQKSLLVRRLDELLGRLTNVEDRSAAQIVEEGDNHRFATVSGDPREASAMQAIAQPARDLLSVTLSSAGLLENYELKLSPERRTEEFQKIRTAVQDFARLLDEVTV